MSKESIITSNLSIGYPGKVVQKMLNLSFFEGELVGVIGPNGCGKSTFLRTIAGLQPCLSGGVSFPLTEAEDYAKRVALVLTERFSLPNTRVRDVVAMGRYPYTSLLGKLTSHDEAIIEQSLDAVGLLPMADTCFAHHSDGEQQRVLMAKALAQQTPLIVLDEPTAHLDIPNRIYILRLLRQLAHEQGKTILLSTHELDLAIQFSDRILLMTANRGFRLAGVKQLVADDAFTDAFQMDVFNASFM